MVHKPVIEEIATNIYRISVPLPIDLLDSVNAYVIISPNRSLLVDSGLRLDSCMRVVQSSLQELNVDLRRTDFMITHHHADHFGLVSWLITDESAIYISGPEVGHVERIRSGMALRELTQFLELSGFPLTDPCDIIPSDAESHFRDERPLPFRFVQDDTILDVGTYSFRCVRTPGHSSDHICLYEPRQRFFLSGDHLLRDITSGIQARSEKENPLQEYLESLDRIYNMDVDLVLPGHGPIFTHFRERIEQLKEHHEIRSKEVLLALTDRGKDAYEIASRITWSIADREGWASLPLLQRFFATGETLAHLQYLEGKGFVQKQMHEKRLIYSLRQKPQ